MCKDNFISLYIKPM